MQYATTRLFRSLLGIFCLSLAFITGLTAAPQKFAHETSDLKPDPAVHFGVLTNGMRYAVAANHEPKGRASLRLLVNAGSLYETDDQQGLAHFLEHMAFNGSTHYPPGTLIEFFQRMGMSFGGDTNASTSFDHTQYLLELSSTQEATMAEGLHVLSDYANGLLLAPKEIDNERGIILSEKRARDSVGFRSFVAEHAFVFEGTRIPSRLPIGQAEVIQNAPRERFLDFYNTWYRPDLCTIVAVGDFDASAVEKQIVAIFSPFSARAPERTKPDFGRIAPSAGLHVKYHGEPEAPATQLSLSAIAPYQANPDTAAKRIEDLPRQIANAIINQRLSILVKKEGAPFSGARAGFSTGYDLIERASITLMCKPEQWEAALALGEQELRRAIEFGFQEAELKEVVANYLKRLEIAVKAAPTRRSPEVADALCASIKEEEVFTSEATDMALLKPALEKITIADCATAFRKIWKPDNRFIFVTGNVNLGADAEPAIKAAYEKAHAKPVTPPEKEAAAVWAYSNFGAPGKIAQRQQVADLDATLITFENGVRLNIKKTDFTAGIIGVRARVGDGSMTEPASKRGLTQIAASIFDLGGLGKHSTDDMRRILAGKTVGLRFNADTDAFELSGNTSPGDLLLQFQLLAAKITDPGYRPEAMRLTRKGIEQLYIGFQHTPNGPLALELANLIADGDPRFGLPSKEVLLSRTIDEVKAWLQPSLSKGPIEVAVVGDLDIDAVIDAAAKTLGALPVREKRIPHPELLKVRFPAQPFQREYSIDSQIPKGLAVFYWPTTDGLDAHIARRLSLLASVMTDRLRVKIREEMGGTYSARARSFASDTFPAYGYLNTNIDIDPATAVKIRDAVNAIATDLANNGVTEDELNRAKLPLMTSLRESARTNAYWLNVLGRAQEKPIVLDWARDRESDNQAISKADLDNLAKTYLQPGKVSSATIVPQAAKPAPRTP